MPPHHPKSGLWYRLNRPIGCNGCLTLAVVVGTCWAVTRDRGPPGPAAVPSAAPLPAATTGAELIAAVRRAGRVDSGFHGDVFTFTGTVHESRPHRDGTDRVLITLTGVEGSSLVVVSVGPLDRKAALKLTVGDRATVKGPLVSGLPNKDGGASLMLGDGYLVR